MLLKHVYLYLHLDEYPNELATPFGFRTRYLCNFLERDLRALRFHADGFSKICVQGRHEPAESCPLVSENAAVPTVAFDPRRYEALGPDEHHELFIEMLLEGLRKCSRWHSIPLLELESAIERFRHGGYRNEWVHRKRVFRQRALQASLLCSLDSEKFVLTLRVERKGSVVFEKPILETQPDEIIFAHRFKDVSLDGETLIVVSKFGKTLFSLDLSGL